MPNLPFSAEITQSFSRSCRKTIIKMVQQSQSGHPGGSLSALEMLLTLYLWEISNTNEKVVVSNGHISPAVYAILAELGLHKKEEVIKTFRQHKSKFEGHVTRHVRGVDFGTGPLGTGVSAACGMALAEMRKSKENSTKPQMVWSMIGDGEAQEGQVYEMMLFAAKENLSNFCVLVDANDVQLTDSLQNTMPTPIAGIAKEIGWNVLEINGHNTEDIYKALQNAKKEGNKPTIIIGKTIMGNGVPEMEETGKNQQSTWHGKAPKPDQADQMLANMPLTEEDQKNITEFLKANPWNPAENEYPELLSKIKNVNIGQIKEYGTDVLTDCRGAYGNALLDLTKANKNVFASSADLMGSVKTNGVAKELPNQYAEAGICEQNMVSMAGGMSLNGFIPFCSTFGAFMSSRAKDQARVNDINRCNAKMVATHCGLSVGEDGPTHQAIDDMGSFMGLLNTFVLEPADPNQCDRIIRYVASHYGPFYVRMGRHKLPALTKPDGSLLFDAKYQYKYGKCDVLREGNSVTIVASGPMVHEALKAVNEGNIDAEIIIASSPKQFDETLKTSLLKTKKYITVEDHNPFSGMGSQVNKFMLENNISAKLIKNIGVEKYQLSGQPAELYESAGIGYKNIQNILKSL